MSLLGIYSERTRQHTPVFLPEESHGRRSLAAVWLDGIYDPQGRKESDMTEAIQHAAWN